MNFYDGRKVLVAGGSGLIGRPLVDMLVGCGARVTVASMEACDPSSFGNLYYVKADLRYMDQCEMHCGGKDIVFNLVGVKGSPATTLRYPATFFTPTIQTQTNLMEAARRAGVKHYLYTSTVGVYPPAEVFHENDAWNGPPSPNDRFAGWAKRMGELQAEAYAIEYGFKCSIVRPGNVYGPWDNFYPETAMVLPALIARAMNNGGLLEVWGDGSAIRDFVYAEDIARGMMMAVEQGITEPLNLASGIPVTIREVVELIVRHSPVPASVSWDKSKPKGDTIRLMDISRARSYGYQPQVSLEEGIRRTIEWYANHRNEKKYMAFDEREKASG